MPDRDQIILRWLEVGLAATGAFGIIVAAARATLYFAGGGH